MNNSQSSPRDSCTHSGCEGRRLPDTVFCLVHAETKDQEEAYSDLRRGGELDLTRVQLDRSTLQHIIEAAPKDDAGRRLLRVKFLHSTFLEPVEFTDVVFDGDQIFVLSIFRSSVEFTRALFKRDAHFHLAEFGGKATFSQVTFAKGALFTQAKFSEARTVSCTFADIADYREAELSTRARYEDSIFLGEVDFDDAKFQDGASFVGVRFDAKATLTAMFRVGADGIQESHIQRTGLAVYLYERLEP
jgi:uncharacterized protein YjbI with pentapeptide repeats